ncbi:hypothetical protein BKA65DRAFT_488626 [Rhexocercosporidium sp. MPI-PUGE-AT-0058]|nr:hypothetical protein BKA65DRAFT_488626 [Rhexocercosporidium sp. MPI-PUGE-AT-0058]
MNYITIHLQVRYEENSTIMTCHISTCGTSSALSHLPSSITKLRQNSPFFLPCRYPTILTCSFPFSLLLPQHDSDPASIMQSSLSNLALPCFPILHRVNCTYMKKCTKESYMHVVAGKPAELPAAYLHAMVCMVWGSMARRANSTHYLHVHSHISIRHLPFPSLPMKYEERFDRFGSLASLHTGGREMRCTAEQGMFPLEAR